MDQIFFDLSKNITLKMFQTSTEFYYLYSVIKKNDYANLTQKIYFFMKVVII